MKNSKKVNKLSVLNKLTNEEFSRLSKEALALDGEGCMICKMYSIIEKQQKIKIK